MSDATQGAIMLAVFFALVVGVAWVMRGRLGEIASSGRTDGSDRAPTDYVSTPERDGGRRAA